MENKNILIILPIILIIIFGIGTLSVINDTETNSNTNENIINTLEEIREIEVTSIKFDETNIEMDLKEQKNIDIEIEPIEANAESLEFYTSDSQIAILEKNDIETNENKITLKIIPITEGNCEIYVKSSSGIESNKVMVKVIDNERIQKEEQAKKEAEEKERLEQAKKEAEEKERLEQAKKQEQKTNSSSTTTKKSTSSSQSSTTKKNTGSSTSKSNSNNSNGKKIYRTPSGKRYHYDPDCGGKNSYLTTLNAAKSSGLTPCKKCVH